VNRFFQNVESRAWTDAEKQLDSIRQEIENTPWYKGYVKALEGLLLTFRTNDDKYIYLPKALVNRNEESVNKLRKDFGEFASNEIHGEYDRGYFKALEDYTSLLAAQKTVAPVSSEPVTAETPKQTGKELAAEKVERAKKDADLSPYLEGSS
jgi:hypothetical protein